MMTFSILFFLFAGLFPLLSGVGREEKSILIELKAVSERIVTECPTVVNFKGKIVTKKAPVFVKFRFVRSNGEISSEKTIGFNEPGKKEIGDKWKIYSDFSGWEKIEVFYPHWYISGKARFVVKCKNKRRTRNLPDLKVYFKAPEEAEVGEGLSGRFTFIVKNAGQADANNFYVGMLLVERNKSGKEKRILCGLGFIPILTARGSTEPVKFSPFVPVNVIPGKYMICGEVDSNNTVKETNEANNRVCYPITIKQKEVKK